VGYYGEHNLGDDALLAVLLQQLPRHAEPIATARDQQLVASRFGVACVDRGSLPEVIGALGSATALILGGGSLLQDSTSFRSLLYYAALILLARLQGKPVLLWAQGLGPLRRRRSRLLVRALLARSTACSWRDSASAALARELGWSPQPWQSGVGSDPVWTFPPLAWHGQGGPLLLCFRPTAQLQGHAWRPWLEAIDRLAPHREVIWVPFHAGQDRGLLEQLREQNLLPEGLRGAPVAALSYDPKVQAAARALGCPVHDLAEPSNDPLAPNQPMGDQALRDQLLAAWQACLDQPPSAERLAQLRQAGGLHAELFSRCLG
jgi:polysaccharide pyruvyl transferase CsaB